MFVVPGVPSGTPGDDDHALTGFRKAVTECDAPCAVDHVVLIMRVFRDHTMHAPHQRQFAAGVDARRDGDHRRLRPLACDA